MTLFSTADLVAEAQSRGTAVAAVNVITLEHAEAIVAAADAAGQGVILQLSENAIGYHGGCPEPLTLAVHALADAVPAPLAVHLDHLTDDALVQRVLAPPMSRLVSSLMYDAGALPYDDNLRRTSEVATAAHVAGLWIEAELGYVGGKPGQVARSAHEDGVRTDPEEAAAFVAETGVDALAVAVGSSHAMTDQTARLDHDLIAALAEAVPVPLVLHGSSGVPDDELRAAVRAGIGKVNVGTALNKAMTGAVRERLEDAALTDPRKYLGPGRDAMTAAVLHLLETLR